MYPTTLSIHALLLVLSLPLLQACLNPQNEKPIDYPNPNLELAPDTGKPFLAGTRIPLEYLGYKQQEFFYRGIAYSYLNTTPLESDGQWQVAPAESRIYKTRMLVYRPVDAADFNGTVIVEWLNVTGGIDAAADWITLHTEIMRRGYAWVGVSAQYIGVEGGDALLPTPGGLSLPLKSVSPFRYFGLSHPGDSFSYDIFSQAARAIRYPQDIAPLGELDVQHVIAAGESQSATRLMTFVNAFGPDTDLFDGYFIHSRLGAIAEIGGASAALSQSPQTPITMPDIVTVRQDLGKPVMNLQTETDVLLLNSYFNRQDDSDHFRLWEVAGSAHADVYTIIDGMTDIGYVSSANIRLTSTPIPLLIECPTPINAGPQHHFVAKAALHALNRWIVEGIAPANAPRLAVNTTGDRFEYDAFGNVLGGVRSPYVDVPIARLSGENASLQNAADICFLFGSTERLDRETLQSLYPDHDSYVEAVSNASQDAVTKGFLLQEDAELIIKAAQASWVPPI